MPYTTEFDSTMQEILGMDAELIKNKRLGLEQEIAGMEALIEKNVNDEPEVLDTPEAANKRHKEKVFLKKNLAMKKDEYEQLAS